MRSRVEHDVGQHLTLNNQTRYDQTDRIVESTSASGSVTVAPPGQVALTQGIYQTTNSIISNQTNLTATVDTGSVSQAITSGLELSRETADNPIWAVVPYGAPNPAYLTSIYSPVTFPAALLNYAPNLTGATTDTRINTGALYAFEHHAGVRPNQRFMEGRPGLQASRSGQHLFFLQHLGSPAGHLGLDQHAFDHQHQRGRSAARAGKSGELRSRSKMEFLG